MLVQEHQLFASLRDGVTHRQHKAGEMQGWVSLKSKAHTSGVLQRSFT